MKITIGVLSCVAVMALAAAGCGSKKSSSTTASKSTASQQDQNAGPTGPKAPGARVVITKPANGATEAGTVTATVQLTNFKLDPKDVGKKAQAGLGHLHFAMDEGKFDYPKFSGPNGQLAQKLGVQGKYSPSVTPTITYRNLPKGTHTLEVYLANNDHTNTGTDAHTTFTVK